MQSTDLRRRKRLLGRINEYRIRTKERTLWLAVLLLAKPTMTNSTKLKYKNDSNDKAIDLKGKDNNDDTHLLSNNSNSSMSDNFNKQSKNESYLNSGEYSQTNKENESRLSDTYMVINDTVNIPKDDNTIRLSNKYASNIMENNVARATTDGETKNAAFYDLNDSNLNQENKNIGKILIDEKLELLSNKHYNSIKDDSSTKKDKSKISDNDETSESTVESREVIDAVDFGMKALEELVNVKEPQLYKLGLFLEKDHPAARAAIFGAPINEKAMLVSRFGYASLEASMKIAQTYSKNASRQLAGIPDDLESRNAIDSCPLRGNPICPPASRRFRTSDGTCNNLEHPWWGAGMLPMERLINPVYEDGIQSIRRSVTGDPLPSARQISTVFHRDRNKEIHSVTMMFTQWGQFLDHDITSTIKGRSFNGSIPRCCDNGGQGMLPPDLLHPSCLPIEVPKNDPFLKRFGVRCMEFLRSAPSTRIDCELGWREQISQVTPYIDASTIYGSDVATSDSIRTFRNGQIFYGRPRNQGPLNPPDPPEGELCNAGALTEECLQPGDSRASETPGLLAMHTIFVRYHNKVAAILTNINPHWRDERVYQETRRIVYSVMQHITYREYLPVVLGPEVFGLFDLRGYYKKYNKEVLPTIVNSFATAAYRFGHSMVQNSIIRTDSNHISLPNNVSLHEEISNFNNIWTFGSMDRILLGLANQPSQRRDEFIAEELTNHLFQFSDSIPFGMDLAALNIQRGRDHGIPPYTAWRKPCFMWPVTNWRDLEQDMSINSVIRLKTLYRHVDDIDLFTGGLAEKPVRGGVVGPTFACIIAHQFSNLRRGDRFFYDNEGFESSFTPAQLQQINKISLAQIICQTTDEVETIQPFVFLSADKSRNVRVSCDSPDIGIFDLAPWTEQSFETNRISDNLDSFEQERSQNDNTNRLGRVNNERNKKIETKITGSKKSKTVHNKFKKQDNLMENTHKFTKIFPDSDGHRRHTRSTEDETAQPTDNLLKSRTKTKRTTKKPSKPRPTTLKPFQITSAPLGVKYGFFSSLPKKPPFTGQFTSKPTKHKPQYYQIQDQSYDDVTYLLGILPKHTTKAPPPVTPLQVNINIHYSHHSTATPIPVLPVKKKKRPHTSPKPPTNDYTYKPVLTATHTPTNLYGQNNVVLITKRPATSTKRPAASHSTDVSYPVFIYSPSYENPNAYEVTTKNPNYFIDSYYVTTKKTKRPNTNGYSKPIDVFQRPIDVRPSTGYYGDNYNDDDRYVPINTKPDLTYHGASSHTNNDYDFGNNKKPLHVSDYGGGQFSSIPGVFQSKPFSSSNKPVSIISNGYNTNKYSPQRPFNNYYTDNDSDSDVIVITENKRRPQNVNRDEMNFNDHIFNAFFNRHDSTDKKLGDKNHGTKTKVNANIDGKLDFKSRIVYKKEEGDVDSDGFVEISSVRKEEIFGDDDVNEGRVNDSNDKLAKKQTRSVNKIRIVDINVIPSTARYRWKYFNATEDPTLNIEAPEFPVNIPSSYKIPKPMNILANVAGGP